MALVRRSYVGVTITLVANTPNHIIDLVNTALNAQVAGTQAPGGCREFNIQSDGANTVNVLVGDANVSATNYGYYLTPGASRLYRDGDGNSVQVGGKYAYATAAEVLHIELETA